MKSHLNFTTAGLVAVIHEAAGLAVGFGVLNGGVAGLAVTAAVSAVNAGGLIANAVHHAADTRISFALVLADFKSALAELAKQHPLSTPAPSTDPAQSEPPLEVPVGVAPVPGVPPVPPA